MKGLGLLKSALIGGASWVAFVHPAAGKDFDVPRGDLASALDTYTWQAGIQLIYSDDVVRGRRSMGAKGDYTETAALSRILSDTGLTARVISAGTIAVVSEVSDQQPAKLEQVAQAAAPAAPPPRPAASSVETVIVTAQHKAEDIQQVPIAITALSQQQLTERQIAGGPDLIKEVPNLTFSKTNFTSYNIEIRGIGTQAISATTDPAVAVAFNDIPFIRNHFFEQEFFDVQDVEVLRGPQGTLYGRNATAGVVNLKSALPTDQYEAMASADLGNYSNRRLEGMLNIPVVGDKLDIRIAGEWTKRSGYTFDSTTDTPVDGRDLWSTRLTVGWKPAPDLQTYFVWEHFNEDDDRLRSGKTLCTTDPGPSSVNGPFGDVTNIDVAGKAWLSQGCSPGSLYSPSAYGIPNPGSIPIVGAAEYLFFVMPTGFNPYGTESQSQNVRVIGSPLLPHYLAKNDTLEFNATYNIAPSLTLTSQTGYNNDFLYSTEDFNRFDTVPGAFLSGSSDPVGADGIYCDPQLGCSDRFIAEDLSQEHAKQFSQEFRLTSNYGGPVNFSAGANYLYYQTVEDYYTFSNLLSLSQERTNGGGFTSGVPHYPFDGVAANACGPVRSTPDENFNHTNDGLGCAYVDPNPLSQINGQGHNYFRSENPYLLNSLAVFGESYYQVTPDVKLTGGLRFTDDMKHFLEIPSWTLVEGEGYPVTGVENQQWQELTGRFNATWTPSLDFTDQSLFYASYARGYKGGGANPPGVFPITARGAEVESPTAYTHPLIFKPEFINAFELGTKNTLLDGTMTLNGDVFYYKYWDYQISSIVDRTAINQNFNATVNGAEMEANWEPLPGLRFNFAGGYEDGTLDRGDEAIDLMDRTADHPGWMVVRPFVTQTSNCILPTYVVSDLIAEWRNYDGGNLSTSAGGPPGTFSFAFNNDAFPLARACASAYSLGVDPLTGFFGGISGPGYGIPSGFNPATAPNNGAGFDKNLSGKKLPNMPPFTLSTGAQYSLPVSADWVGTLRADFYWQGNSEARVFNDKPYDSIHGYSTLNLALIFDNSDGWQAMLYVKNVFDVTAITGDFLNSDDAAMSTNVFLTDPRLIGVRVTKRFSDAGERDSGWIDNRIDSYFDDALDFLIDKDGGKPQLWIELGGQLSLIDTGTERYAPPFLPLLPANFPSPVPAERLPGGSFDWNGKLSFEPDGSDWVFSAAVRYGRSSSVGRVHKTEAPEKLPTAYGALVTAQTADYVDGQATEKERHAIFDFMVGKDVGLGMFGGTSVLNGGLRIAQFASTLSASVGADPDYHFALPYSGRSHDIFKGAAQAKRSFHGIGPSISWDASAQMLGNTQNGELTMDWGANIAILFGRRTADVHHQTSQCHLQRYGTKHCYTPATGSLRRSQRVTIPNIGAFAGISWRYQNAKVSFGYRADEFFGAMDGGLATRESENVGFFGPFANISIGLGG